MKLAFRRALGEYVLPSFLCSSSTASARAATIAIAGAPGQGLAARTCHRHTLRCTSDTHGLDTIESFFASRDIIINEFVRKLELIQNLELPPHILDSFEGCHFEVRLLRRLDSLRSGKLDLVS